MLHTQGEQLSILIPRESSRDVRFVNGKLRFFVKFKSIFFASHAVATTNASSGKTNFILKTSIHLPSRQRIH